MFEPIEGGSSVNIQGLECQLPPEGYVFNVLTKQLEFRGIYKRSGNIEQQYWEVPVLPGWYKEVMQKWDDYDKKKKEDEPDFYDERLEELKRQEWDRRLNGYWFYNKGEAIYLTGMYYLYLTWWNIDIGKPKFRIPDLEKFYFLQYCIEDPLSMGMLEVTKRRFGKSFVAGLFVTEYVSRTKMAFGGIQSKTGKDASKFFSKTVVNPFRRLPKFFRPEYDMSLGVNPKSEMRFQKTNVRGKKAESSVDKDELGGGIDHQPSDKVAYDGQKLHRYVGDEIGKTTEVDVYERHEVVRYCLMDDEGNIIGKALMTTTVEKLESDKNGVQDAFKLLWAESDQSNKGENGMTKSGLYRFFMTARRTRYFDVYGYPDEERTLKAIMQDRESVKNNPRSLNARIRKEPLTIEEALMDDGDKCIFNIMNIMEREKQLSESPVFKRKILFWRDGETQKVKWRDIRKGEEDFCWHFSPDADLTNFESNKYIMDAGVRKPARSKIGAIAVDSYSNSQGGRKYGSKASAWVGLRYDVVNPNGTNKAIGHLYGRPKEKDELHEQTLLCAEFFGFPVWFEHNSDSYDSYFRDRGRRGYLGIYPMNCIDPIKKETTERHRGVPTTPYSLTTQHDMGVAYFEKYCHLIDFEDLLSNAKKFDPYDRTAYDTVVSFLILIVVLNDPIYVPPPPKNPLVKLYPNPNYAPRLN